jgi:tRNA1Val (adenine37-N6)-methyltransferase
MPNTFFRFKQFTVHQEKTAMKVCTDACLFGALLAREAGDQQVEHMLDIGAGTGLLSLMVAQATRAKIDAVEIDESAYDQALENFSESPWKERLNLFHTSIQEFDPGYKYDVIFSNPPFYENDLRSPDEKRNLALHSASLTVEDLLGSVCRLLKPGGKFAVLLPSRRADDFEKTYGDCGLNLRLKIGIKDSMFKKPFRYIHVLENNTLSSTAEKEIIIKNHSKGGTYTDEFKLLLHDYYL